MRRALLLFAVACGPPPAAAPPDPTHGPDEALVSACEACHADVAQQWSSSSSHTLLLDCASCHTQVAEQPGPGHQSSRACADCHSVKAHQSFDCTTCHQPHGSPNLFLIAPKVNGADVHLTRAEGASADGLVRFGVAGQQAGTGTCEICHGGTRYYRSSGDGAPHDASWCPACHLHENGFNPSP